MWLFTKYGFFSAVCARQGEGKHDQPVDTDRIMVRARVESHLEALKRRFPDSLGECAIQEFARSDYRYRLFVQKSAWTQIVAGFAEETDYDDFKSEVARHQGRAGAGYQHSLHEVWAVMLKLQETEGPPPITTKQMDAILPFHDRFQMTGFSAGSWNRAEGHFPFFDFDEAVSEFLKALYDNGWINPKFDWTTWQNFAEEIVNSPGMIEQVSATTIQKLFTTHCRKDRFCEGHLASMFENGHIEALLTRLKAIRDKIR